MKRWSGLTHAKSAVCWLALLLALGCRTIATHVPEKSVEDLYFEAVSQVHPETTLGLANGGNSPAVEGTILPPAPAGLIPDGEYGPVPP
ncbi:MAG: hypothetical protein KDA69_14310, partial [Planctomycetaceae bacterium]|nr:hypothetical protein [Planctomycetaceae bacterium]